MEAFTDSDFLRISREHFLRRLMCMCFIVVGAIICFAILIKSWAVFNFDPEYLPWFITGYILVVLVVGGCGAYQTLEDYWVYKEHKKTYGVLPTNFRKIEKRELWNKMH